MSNNPTIRLQYIVDQASVTKTRQVLNEVVQNLKAIGGQAAKDSETVKRFQAEISALDRLAAIGRLTKQMFEFSQETGDSREAVQKLRDTLQEIGTSADEINDATLAFRRMAKAAEEAKQASQGVSGLRLGLDVAGDASTVGGAVGSVFGGIGGGAAAQGAAQFVGDALGAVESLSRLGDTVQQLSNSVGGLAGKLGALAGKGIGALATAATVAIPALAVLAIGITAIQAAQEKAVAAFSGALEGYRKAAALIATGSEESVKAEIEAAKDRIKAAEATKQAAENVKRSIDAALGPAAGLIGAIYGYGATLDANNEAIKEADKTIAENRKLVEQLERALTEGQVATKTSAELEAELKRQREELNATTAAALRDAIAREVEYAELLRTGTSEAINDRIAALKVERDALQNFLKNLTGPLTEGEQKVFDEQKARLVDLENTIARLSGPILDGVTAREREEQAVRNNINALNESAQNQVKFAELIRTGTSEQARARQAAIDTERAALEKQLVALRALPDTSGKVAAEIERVEKRLNDLATEAGVLSNALPNIKLREFGAELKRGVEEAARKVQDALKKQQGEIIGAVGKYDQDVARIEEDALKRRADIQKNYNDALINAAKRAADDAAKALAQLQERRASLARDFGRAEADASARFQEQRLNAQIEYQRREVQAEQERVRRLEDIRRDAQRREFDLALNRDFAGLFASRLDTTRAIEDTNIEFRRGQQDRATEFAQRQADAARAFEVERQQRLAKYQQDLADAQAQYERERALIAQQRAQALAEAQANRARALNEERTAYQRQLAARREALNAELRTIAEFGRERVKLEAELFRRGIEIIRGLGAGVGQGVTRRASGGPLTAGQAALVNDGYAGQRERFNGTLLPSGLGVFIPARSGNVSAGSAPSIDLTFNVTGGNDPTATAQAIRATVEGVLKEYFT